MTTPTATDRLWTIHDAAEYFQVPISAIYKMTAPKGSLRIPHVRIAGRLRFRRADLDAWLSYLTVSNLDVLKKFSNHKKVFDGHHS